MPTCMHWSLTVLALILLYGGHCFSVRLPSKVMRGFTHHVRLPASCNNVPQQIAIFPDAIMAAYGVYLCFITGNRQNGFWSFQ